MNVISSPVFSATYSIASSANSFLNAEILVDSFKSNTNVLLPDLIATETILLSLVSVTKSKYGFVFVSDIT